jgi:hypothetical protein
MSTAYSAVSTGQSVQIMVTGEQAHGRRQYTQYGKVTQQRQGVLLAALRKGAAVSGLAAHAHNQLGAHRRLAAGR